MRSKKLMIEFQYKNFASSRFIKTTAKTETVVKKLLEENREYAGAIFRVYDILSGEELVKVRVPKCA